MAVLLEAAQSYGVGELRFRHELTELSQGSDGVRVPMRCYGVGPNGPLTDTTGEWLGLYGIDPEGAVLVRPDGFVAWRARTADSNSASRLIAAFRHILSLDADSNLRRLSV